MIPEGMKRYRVQYNFGVDTVVNARVYVFDAKDEEEATKN